MKRKLVFFSNVTLGYGSPKYIYFLEKAARLNLFSEMVSYEPFEKLRPFFDLNKPFKRKIVGKLISPLGHLDSHLINKYILVPSQKLSRNITIFYSALTSYVKPLFVVTTYESPLFGLFSKKAVFLQNFSEIWEEIEGQKGRGVICERLLVAYYKNTRYLLAPQKDRLEMAASRYVNAKKYLVHNSPRLDDFPSLSLNLEKIKILYQGRLSDDSLGDKILDLAENLSPDVEFHLAGIVNKNYAERVDRLHKEGKLIYHGYLNWQDLNELRKQCNVGLVSWSNNTLNTKYCAPNKLYEYIATGMYVVCFENYSLNDLNEQYSFGDIRAEAADLASVINTLSFASIKKKGIENYNLFVNELNYESQTKELFSDLLDAESK